MTRNIQESIGSINMEGYFIPAFTSLASVVFENMIDMDPVLHLLLRDDMMAWYASKSSARTDAEFQKLERQLADRVSKNFFLVNDRVHNCSVRDNKIEKKELLDSKLR